MPLRSPLLRPAPPVTTAVTTVATTAASTTLAPTKVRSRRTARRTALLLVVVLAAIGASCSSDDDQGPAARNGSNVNARSIVAFGADLPTMPAARSITRGTIEAGAWHRTYEVDADPAAVLDFYQQQLPSLGYKTSTPPSTTPGGAGSTWRRPGFRLDVTVAPGAATTSTTTSSTAATATSTVNLALSRTSGS
jgi:hypothetical protein